MGCLARLDTWEALDYRIGSLLTLDLKISQVAVIVYATARKALLNPGVGRLLTLGLYIIIGKIKPNSYTLARPGCWVGVSQREAF